MQLSADDLLDLLGSDLNRHILALTSEQARDAEAIAERCEASLPTVYRHIDDLESADLLVQRTQYDLEGNHYKTYRGTLDAVELTFAADELTADVTVDEARTLETDEVDDGPAPEDVERAGTQPAADDVERPGSEG